MPARFRSHFGGGSAMLAPLRELARLSYWFAETGMRRRRDESTRSSLVGRLHGASPLPIPVSRYLGARFDLSGSG